jgi:hypothetical protein
MKIRETNTGGNHHGSALMRNLVKEIGLELEESTSPFDAWVIERVEKPTENRLKGRPEGRPLPVFVGHPNQGAPPVTNRGLRRLLSSA